jgi:hypothetical protein
MAAAEHRKFRPIGGREIGIGWGGNSIGWIATSKKFDSLPK